MMIFALVFVAAAAIESDVELKQGQALMEAFDYEKAAEVFSTIAKRPAIADPDRAVALVWLGLAAAELRDQARASVAFEDAVVADPLIVLPRDASPKIKALLEDARARVRLRPKADVAPPPPTPPTPPPIEPGPPPAPSAGFSPLAIGVLAVGGVVTIAGGAVWGAGLLLRQQAEEEPFQTEAAKLRDQSVAAQIGGQVMTGVGVLALAAGGVLLALNALE